MVRRKGERPVERTWPAWDCDWHPVRRMIEGGDNWVNAWSMQAGTPRRSGMPLRRLIDLSHDAQPTAADLDMLAERWSVDVSQLIASLPSDMREKLR